MFEREYQCDVCQHYFSHPVDACPICVEPFYWLVVPTGPVTAAQKTAFLQIMEDMVESSVGREFLTHDGHLWLPHNFWQYANSGDILNTFAWIQNIKLVQHPNPQKRKFFEAEQGVDTKAADEESVDEDVFDTQPIPIMRDAPVSTPITAHENMPPVKIRTKPAISLNPEYWGPIAVSAFFVLMAMTYFALCAHRNINLTQRDEPHEQLLP